MMDNTKRDGYQRGLALMVYIFFDEEVLLGRNTSTHSRDGIISEDQRLANKLHTLH